MSQEVGYPPLDTLKPIDDAVWIVDSHPIKAGGLPLPVRMTVVRLSNGGLLLYSPTRYTPTLRRDIEGLGTIRHLVAPNVGHWMFLRDWQRACPEARTWGVPGLRDRAQVRAAGVRIDTDLGPVPPDDWSGEIDQVLVRSTVFAEVDMFHRPSRTLMLADLVLNVEGRRMPPLPRVMAGALGILAPHGRAPLYLRLLLRLNRSAVARAASRLVAFEPRRVIVSHGSPFERDATAQLRHSLGWLIGTGAEALDDGNVHGEGSPALGGVGAKLLVTVGLVLGIGTVLVFTRNRRGSA